MIDRDDLTELNSARDKALAILLASATRDIETVRDSERNALLAWMRAATDSRATFRDFWNLLNKAVAVGPKAKLDEDSLNKARAGALLGFMRDVNYETPTLGSPAMRVGDIVTQIEKKTIEERGVTYAHGVMRKALLLPSPEFGVPENIRPSSPMMIKLSRLVGTALDHAIEEARNADRETEKGSIDRDVENSLAVAEETHNVVPSVDGIMGGQEQVQPQRAVETDVQESRQVRHRAARSVRNLKSSHPMGFWGVAGVLASIVVVLLGAMMYGFFNRAQVNGLPGPQASSAVTIEAAAPNIEWKSARFWVPLTADLASFPSGPADCATSPVRKWLTEHGSYQAPMTLVVRNGSSDSPFWLSNLRIDGADSAPEHGYIVECSSGGGGMGPGETTQLSLEATQGSEAVFVDRNPNYFTWKLSPTDRLIAGVSVGGNRDFVGTLSLTVQDVTGHSEQVPVTDADGATFTFTHHGSGYDPWVKLVVDAQRGQLIAKNADLATGAIPCTPTDCQKILEEFWSHR